MNDDPTPPPTAIVEHSTCLACGCLCDDIRVEARGDRIVEAGNACAIGRPWFLAPRPGEGHSPATIDGRPAGLAEAIGRAAQILRGSKAPVVWGLSGTTVEAVASALAIADRIGAVVDLAGSSHESAKLAAFQRVGQVSASLGEVKDRADVVVFWRCDPLVTHPRHWERYSVVPRGRFVPGGRAGRFVIVVDAEPTETSRAADLFVRIDPTREPETVDILRALAQGVAIDPDRAARSGGVPFPTLEALARRLTGARYGAWFLGASGGTRAAESLLRLVRDLNVGRRFVALELGEAGNRAGASAASTWQAGSPSTIDYGLGYPRHLPGEATLRARLESGEIDAALLTADGPEAGTLDRLAGVPLIRIAPGATAIGLASAVAFDVARPGIEVGGTVARVDGVMLPLRPAIRAGLPGARDILEEIGRSLGPPSRGVGPTPS